MKDAELLRQQIAILSEIANRNKKENNHFKGILSFVLLLVEILKSDWKNYTLIDKLLFIGIWSPVLLIGLQAL